MNFGGGFLGVGPAEVVVIVVVGWVVLGPQELLRVSKEVGSFLGSLRSSADEARRTLTDALEMEALEKEYNKTVNAFRKGYEDTVSGRPDSALIEEEAEKKEAARLADKAADPATRADEEQETPVSADADAKKVDTGEELQVDAFEKGADGVPPSTSTVPDIEGTVKETHMLDGNGPAATGGDGEPAASGGDDEQARRFRDQMLRVESEFQVPPSTAQYDPLEARDELQDDTEAEITELELAYIDERAKLELQQLDRKYKELRQKIVDRRNAAQASATDSTPVDLPEPTRADRQN